MKMGIVDRLVGNSGPSKVERLKAKKRVKKLWRMAKGDHPVGSTSARRAYAAKMALVEIGEPAVPNLIKALRKGRHVRRATQILCLMEERAVGPLVQILDDKDDDIRDTAKDTLKRMSNAKAREALAGPEGGIAGLINKVKHGRADTCLDAAKLLAKTGDRRAIDALIYALEDGGHDRKTQMSLAMALADIGDERAIGPLERALFSMSYLCSLHPIYWQYVERGTILPYLRDDLNEQLRIANCAIAVSPGAKISNEGGRWEIEDGMPGIYEMKAYSDSACETGSGTETLKRLDLFLTSKHPTIELINEAIHRIKCQKR
jgi:hypothetical protein